MEYKALRKNASADQADAKVLEALRTLPLAALSDSMHRNIGSSGLHPYHRGGKQPAACPSHGSHLIIVWGEPRGARALPDVRTG